MSSPAQDRIRDILTQIWVLAGALSQYSNTLSTGHDVPADVMIFPDLVAKRLDALYYEAEKIFANPDEVDSHLPDEARTKVVSASTDVAFLRFMQEACAWQPKG